MSTRTARSRLDWRSQFRAPRGALGALFGHVMAYTNRRINRLALDGLAPAPEDAVLEVGFGHGKLLAAIAARAPDGFVGGVDPSSVMLKQATRRNRRALDAGTMRLKLGSISRIPFPDGRFDRVCSVNTIYFWPDPARDLVEVRRVLKPGGRLLVAFRKKNPIPEAQRALSGLSGDDIQEIRDTLEQAGFADIRLREQEDPAPAWNFTTHRGSYSRISVCLSATRTAAPAAPPH